MGGREDLDGALKAIMAAKREELGGPPTPEELLAYRDGTLDPAAREELEARLAVYPDAARTLADIAAFPNVEPAPGTPLLSEEDVEVRWQALRGLLTPIPSPIALPTPGGPHPLAPSPAPPEHALPGRGGIGSSPLPVRGSGRRERGDRGVRAGLAAAASIALVVGAAAGFLAGRAGRTPSDSAVNVAVVELSPIEEAARAAAKVVDLPKDSEELLLVLGLPEETDLPVYSAEILDAGGARVWDRQGLRPTPLGTLHLSFRRGALLPGVYRVYLYGQREEGGAPVATYELRLIEE